MQSQAEGCTCLSTTHPICGADVRENFAFRELRSLENHTKRWLDKHLHIAQDCV